MKKLLFLSLIAILSVFIVSCERDKEPEQKKEVETQITVKVVKGNTSQNGVTVYMFDSEKPATFKPLFAKKSVITENGVATFKLQEVHDLNLIDKQTTIYFAVFKDETILGRTGVTIEKGQNKTTTITIP